MKTLENLVNELRREMSDDEIAAGLGNGEIELPDGCSMSESADHVKVWDNNDGGSAQMGFYRFDYN